MPHNKLAAKSQWLKTAKVYTSFMIYVQHGSIVGWYFAYQNYSGLRLLGASPSGECWWQRRRAWRFAHGLFTISAHISLVRTSLMAPPKCKGFGKGEGADGMFGSTTVSSDRDDFSRQPCFWMVQDTPHGGDPVS